MKQRGTTLLELIVVVVIVAIFAAVGLPAMSDFVKNSRLSSARSTFVADLGVARGEAIKRNARVLVCSGNLANGCTNNANWSATGWIVCYDADKNGVCDVAAVDNPNPFVVRDALDATVSLAGPAAPVAYNPIGSQGVPGAANVVFTMKGTWTGAAAAKTISIAPTGFATVK